MSKYRVLLIIPFIAVMFLAWYIVSSNDGSKIKKQRELLEQAAVYAEDKVYVKAIPLAVEAYNIDTALRYTEIESILMGYYSEGGYTDEYYSMVNDRVAGGRAEKSEYLALAGYYFDGGERASGLDILEKAILEFDADKLPEYYGIKGLTGSSGGTLYSDGFTELYDENRYEYSLAMFSFSDVGAVGGKYFAALDGETGSWGIYSSSGKKLSGCVYSGITNVTREGYATVRLGDEYLLVNSKGVRYALCKDERVTEVIRTEGENISIVKCSDGLMYRAEDMELSEKGYEYYGAKSEGYRAICKDGKWYLSGDDAPETSCDEIKVNRAGEAVLSGRVFIKRDGVYRLMDMDGTVYDGSFEDAKPFCSGGELAAVKTGGKWGFADKSGNIVIDCRYEDAQSFCSAGAGMVRCGDGYWRFIDVRGNVSEDYEFTDAREFSGTSAAVRGPEENWTVVTVN